MWMYEEMIDGKKLTEIVNTQHENIKYLPGIKIPEKSIQHKNTDFITE
jgi:glycerol-3-phosphate dehydrogenase (NAD+)